MRDTRRDKCQLPPMNFRTPAVTLNHRRLLRAPLRPPRVAFDALWQVKIVVGAQIPSESDGSVHAPQDVA